MAERAYVPRPVEWLLPALLGEVRVSADAMVRIEDFFVPLARGATFPWKSHALWFYTQMARWGQIQHRAGHHEAIARETYRPDLYRAALKPLGAPLPAANYKVEGALTAPTPVGASGATLTLGPDGFFDGGLFDPDHVAAYIEAARSRDFGIPALAGMTVCGIPCGPAQRRLRSGSALIWACPNLRWLPINRS